MSTTTNKLFCSNPDCDFEFDHNPTCAAIHMCPKCGGMSFQSPKVGLPFLLLSTTVAQSCPYTIAAGGTMFLTTTPGRS